MQFGKMAKKIMIVDDEVNVGKAVQIVLENAGYDVVITTNGEECLDKLKKEKVDIILLDVRMPGMDGWQVLKKIKDSGIIKNTKVAMFTVKEGPGREIFGLQDIVSDYIQKPFDNKDLINRVKAIIG